MAGWLLSPHAAFAAVQVTEIMYNAPGSDTGREWVEVSNTGATPVDLSGWKLFEAGVNHALSLTSGTTTLLSGATAVIANNTEKFLVDYPQYAGTLFKSSFSLSNTGEALALKDKSLVAEDSVSYSSGMGADGDGNSLHLSASSWIPGAPNPGSTAATKAIVPAPAQTATKPPSKSKSTSLKSDPSSSETAAVENTPLAAPVVAPLPTTIGSPLIYSLMGLTALVVLGVAGVLFARRGVPATSPSADEFTIEG